MDLIMFRIVTTVIIVVPVIIALKFIWKPSERELSPWEKLNNYSTGKSDSLTLTQGEVQAVLGAGASGETIYTVTTGKNHIKPELGGGPQSGASETIIKYKAEGEK